MGLALGGTLLAATPAMAQADERGLSISERPRSDYAPYGYRLGSIVVNPSIDVIGDYTDNFRASSVDKQSDFYLTVAPEVRIQSDWNRNRIDGRAYFNRSIHARLPQEDVSQFGGALGGTLDVSRQTAVRIDISADRSAESRTSLGSFRGTLEPVILDKIRAGLSVSQEFNALQLVGAAGGEYTNFHDALGTAGEIDQDFRDVRAVYASATAKYRLRDGIALLVSARVDDNRYTFRAGKPGFDPLLNLDRASSGYSLQAGVSFELTSLIFGSLQAGVLNRNYDDARLRDFSGLSFSGNLLWNATPLTSVRLRAERSIEDTSSTVVAGNTRSEGALSIEHELYRYVILSADTIYAHFEPNGVGASGNELSVGLKAKYLLDRRWSITGSVRHSQRTSESRLLRFQANMATVTTRFAF